MISFQQNYPKSQPHFDLPLRFLLRRRNPTPNRQDFPRRYEDSKSDPNELPLNFQITFRPKESALKASSPALHPRGTPEIILDDNDQGLLEENEDMLEAEDEYPQEDPEDFIPGLLPPPHPICFTEGLIPDSFRCQIFYECVIEDRNWVVYRWRCKRGFYYDPESVSCLRGIC